jgi:hypothetical protein
MRISTREEEGVHDQSLRELKFRVSLLFPRLSLHIRFGGGGGATTTPVI